MMPKKKKMKTISLSNRQEHYLEAIYQIAAQKGAARPKDISRRLNVTHSSVTAVIQKLADLKFINYAPYEVITLTPTGEQKAKAVHRQKEILRDFYIKVLDVDREIAETACRSENKVPETILEKISELVRFFENRPEGTSAWISWRAGGST
jgi:DtxR family Mn-dependent transcriptional regulator